MAMAKRRAGKKTLPVIEDARTRSIRARDEAEAIAMGAKRLKLDPDDLAIHGQVKGLFRVGPKKAPAKLIVHISENRLKAG